MSEEGRIIHHHHEINQPSNDSQPPPPPPVVPPYGTFQEMPSSPSIGFPPHGSMDYHHHPSPYYNPPYHTYQQYQPVPGNAVADGKPVGDHHRLPCCGLGYGWFLFILGFFLGGIPWYAAAIYLICSRNMDPREKTGYIFCTFFSVLGIIVTYSSLRKADDW